MIWTIYLVALSHMLKMSSALYAEIDLYIRWLSIG